MGLPGLGCHQPSVAPIGGGTRALVPPPIRLGGWEGWFVGYRLRERDSGQSPNPPAWLDAGAATGTAATASNAATATIALRADFFMISPGMVGDDLTGWSVCVDKKLSRFDETCQHVVRWS